MTPGSDSAARQVRAAHDKLLREERTRRTALFAEVVEAAQVTSTEKIDSDAITTAFARMLDRLSTVKVLAQKDANVKSTLGKRTWSQAQQAFLQQSEPDGQQEPGEAVQQHVFKPMENLASLLETAKHMSKDPLAMASLDLCWKCTTEALNGNFERVKTVGALRALTKAIKDGVDRADSSPPGVTCSRIAQSPSASLGELCTTPETQEKGTSQRAVQQGAPA